MTATRSILARSAVVPHALAAPAATVEPIRNSRRLITCPSHNDWRLGGGIGPVVPGYEYFQKTGLQTHGIDSRYTKSLADSNLSRNWNGATVSSRGDRDNGVDPVAPAANNLAL